MLTNIEIAKMQEELNRLRQFHADIVLARHGWCKDECSWEADERYIGAIYHALLKHNPNFGL